MKKTILFLLAMTLSLMGCTSEFIRKNDDRYLQPGALDPLLTGYYDVYQFEFLRRYKITHAWPLPARACKYRSLPTLNRGKDRYKGEIFSAPEIYEADHQTWQASNTGQGPWNFDRFVRPTYKRQIPEFGPGGIKTGRMLDKEEVGLEPVCFEAWVGTSHSTALRLYKSSLNERIVFYSKRPGKQSRETIGTHTWWVWRYPIDDGSPKAYGGEAWVRSIGDTGYTLALELGAGPESVKFPQAHANFQAMFRHLIESVRVEEIKP